MGFATINPGVKHVSILHHIDAILETRRQLQEARREINKHVLSQELARKLLMKHANHNKDCVHTGPAECSCGLTQRAKSLGVVILPPTMV